MKNTKHLYAQFTISDKDLKTLYSKKLYKQTSNMSTYDFKDSDRGPDYVIERANKVIQLMNDYKHKTQKFGVIEANVNKDNK